MIATEAIDIIKAAIAEVEWNYPLDYAIAFETAIKALEKQIPQKPSPTGEDNVRYAMNYVCQSCGKHFTGTGIADYCYHCGQALDWGDKENV